MVFKPTHVNRIADILSVQGYVDDTTMAGDIITGMQFLQDVWQVCEKLWSAGIQIDQYHCWKASRINWCNETSGCCSDDPRLHWVTRLLTYQATPGGLEH